MKIVHLSNYYQPQLGYQEPNLVKSHAEAGHEVHVITSDRYYPFPDYQENYSALLGDRKVGVQTETNEHITIHRLPHWFEYPQSAFIILKGLKAILHQIQPDLVIAHDILTPTAYLVAKYKKNLHYKLLYDVHESFHNTNIAHGLIKRTYLFFWKHWFRNIISKKADKIIAIGTGEQVFAATLFKKTRDSFPIVPLGADISRFSPNPDQRKKMREKMGIPEEEVVFIYAGKIRPDKKIHLLLQCLGKMESKNIPYKLLLIGSGHADYEARLAAISKQYNLGKYLIRKDFVSNEELPSYLNTADVGVWPGSPSNGIQEAIACGLPVIIPAHETTKFLVKGAQLLEDNGLIFPADNATILTKHLEALLQNTDMRKRQGALSRKKAEQILDWDIIAKQFLEMAQ